MKPILRTSPSATEPVATPASPTRRGWVVGAGLAGAAALAAHTLRTGPAQPSVAAADVRSAASQGEGYRLTDHVKRYYETTKA